MYIAQHKHVRDADTLLYCSRRIPDACLQQLLREALVVGSIRALLKPAFLVFTSFEFRVRVGDGVNDAVNNSEAVVLFCGRSGLTM